VGVDEVWLLDESDLDLEGGDERCEADETDYVGDHHGESGGRDEHGGEDRVSCEAEGPVGDEVGAFVGVDADSPRCAHRVLGGDGERDAGDGHDDPGDVQPCGVECRDVAESDDGGDGGGEADEDRDAEPDLGPPLWRVGLSVEAKSAVAGAAPLVDGPPPERK